MKRPSLEKTRADLRIMSNVLNPKTGLTNGHGRDCPYCEARIKRIAAYFGLTVTE